MSHQHSSLRILAIYAGAFIGPFSGLVVVAILPEIAAHYDLTPEVASIALVANIIPFAIMMLFSGSLSVRIGKARTVKIGYATNVLASAASFLAPTWEAFLISYAFIGFANALTTPILMSILKDSTPRNILGKRLGTYVSMQALGQLSSPFLSGLIATFNWKYIFILTGIVGLVLLCSKLPYTQSTAPLARAETQWGVVRRNGSPFFLMYFVLGLASLGIPYLVSIYVYDSWNATSLERGLVIMVGGVAVFLLSSFIGTLVDKYQPRIITIVGAVATVVGLLVFPFTHNPLATAATWCLVFVGAQTCMIAINTQVLTKPGSDSLVSITLSLRFFGNAFSPVLILPVFLISPYLGFALCATVILIGLAVLLINTRRDPAELEHASSAS